MTKAVFLDRDGTINIEKEYLFKIEDFEFLPGAIEGLKLLQNAGYLLIVVTNQSGIGRGFYSEEDFINLSAWMLQELEKKGVLISKIYYCPHHPEAQIERYRKVCMCRKPALGMFYKAAKEFEIDLSKSYAIGDRIRDCAICERTACKGFLISNNEDEWVLRATKEGKFNNIRYSADVLACARQIIAMEGLR